MRLFLLVRTENVGPIYDCNNGCVVRAKNETEARKLAATLRGDEGPDVWTDPKRSSCETIPSQGEPGIIMVDFHAG